MFEKLEKLQIVTLSIVLAAGLICSAKVLSGTFSNDQITVTGSASEIVKSDSGRLQFEITARQPNKAAAYAQIQKQMPVVMQYLEDKGVAKEDIELKSVNGYNQYKYTPNGNAYYNISQQISINSKDVYKIKEISTDITSLISKGIDINVFEPSYFYSQLSGLKVKLLEDATTDAKQRAEAMLKSTHNRPGKIQSVRMGVFQITPPDSTNVSDYGINDTSTIDKKVTSVANVVFRIK